MNLNKHFKIYTPSHPGLVGSACWKVLEKLAYSNFIGRISKELDLRNQSQVSNMERINWDYSKNYGQSRKLMDSSKTIQLGCRPSYNSNTGILNN